MPTLPLRIGKKRPYSQKDADERNIRQMERAYSDREEVMSPSRMEGREEDRNTPAREDYRLFKRLRTSRRSGGR